jgi:DNA-binding transcriptional regulator YiaG
MWSEIMAVIDHKRSLGKSRATNQPKVQMRQGTVPPVKPVLIAEIRKRLRMNQMVFARLLPVSVRSLATLESGTPPTDVVARRLIELKRLINALSEVMKQESIGTWVQTPNEAFDGLKPLEVIDRGEIDRLWSMIYDLRSGVPL